MNPSLPNSISLGQSSLAKTVNLTWNIWILEPPHFLLLPPLSNIYQLHPDFCTVDMDKLVCAFGFITILKVSVFCLYVAFKSG